MTEQDEQAAKEEILRAELRLREIQVARVVQAENFFKGGDAAISDAASKLIRLGISGPYDGIVEINSCATETNLSLPVADVDLLIESRRNLDRKE